MDDMQNIEMELSGSILTIKIDLSQEHGPSSTGKSIKVASTSGNVPLGVDGIRIGINAFKPLPDTAGIFAGQQTKRTAKKASKRSIIKR